MFNGFQDPVIALLVLQLPVGEKLVFRRFQDILAGRFHQFFSQGRNDLVSAKNKQEVFKLADFIQGFSFLPNLQKNILGDLLGLWWRFEVNECMTVYLIPIKIYQPGKGFFIAFSNQDKQFFLIILKWGLQ